MTGEVLLDIEGQIATVTLSQPARLNAINAAMWRAIAACFHRLDADNGLRVIVLKGAGERAFCVGADIKEFGEVRQDRAAALAYGALGHAATEAIAACRHPVVAAIRGLCVGGGLELAAACDLRIATRSSRFGVPVKRLGLPADYAELRQFLKLARPADLLDLLLDGNLVDAAEAHRIGLVNRIADDDGWEDALSAYIASIAEGAPLVARAHKAMIARLAAGEEPSPKEEEASFALFDSEDYAIGRAAFAAGIKPEFVGR